MSHVDPNQRIFLSGEYLFDPKTFSEFETFSDSFPLSVRKPRLPEGQKHHPHLYSNVLSIEAYLG